jgi:hypothetical protein
MVRATFDYDTLIWSNILVVSCYDYNVSISLSSFEYSDSKGGVETWEIYPCTLYMKTDPGISAKLAWPS